MERDYLVLTQQLASGLQVGWVGDEAHHFLFGLDVFGDDALDLLVG